ncbi:MAG: carbohydrate binding domain-containing protein [Candidatus Omnitrophota bacterium]
MNRFTSLITIAVAFSLVLSGCGNKAKEPPVTSEKGDAKNAVETIKKVEARAPEPLTAKKIAKAPAPAVPSAQPVPPSARRFMIADFNSGVKPNKIGGNFGAWDKDPQDRTQTCKETFDSVTRVGEKGFSMKLDYDVDSESPAYNGFWMFLMNFDASGYDNLSFFVKGDKDDGYTTVFKVELKNAQRQAGRYYVSNVTEEWQEIVVPLADISGMTDMSNLTEFVIVFEDRIASNKDGVIHIDDIAFTKN